MAFCRGSWRETWRHLRQDQVPVVGKLNLAPTRCNQRSLDNNQPHPTAGAYTWPWELPSLCAISESCLLQKEPRHPAEMKLIASDTPYIRWAKSNPWYLKKTEQKSSFPLTNSKIIYIYHYQLLWRYSLLLYVCKTSVWIELLFKCFCNKQLKPIQIPLNWTDII